MAAFLRKYATATHIYVPMIKLGVVDFALGTDWTPATGDVKVSIDGGAAANIGTLPTAIAMGNTAFWDFTIATGEATGKKITITVGDASTKAVEDQMILIETYGHASAEYQADLSAANLAADVQTIKTQTVTCSSGVTVNTNVGTTQPVNFTGTGTTAYVKAGLWEILGTVLTETAGQIAAAFKQFFNVGTPTGTVNLIPRVTLTDTCTTNTDMRGTDNAALAASWTSTRAGYLDKLNISGNVAGSAEVTAIQNNTRCVIVVPQVIERPDSGTDTYKIHLYLYDEIGNMEAPDSAPNVTLVNAAGTDRSSRLGSATGTLVNTGHYSWTYTNTSTDTLEQLLWEFTVIEGGATRLFGRDTLLVDTTAVDFTSADRTTLQAAATAAALSSVASSVSGIDTKLGSPAGASVSADIAAVKSDTNTLLQRVTATLFSGITYMSKWLGALAGKTADSGTLAEINATTAGAGYNNTTDSQEAIRDRGDSAWTGGAGGGTTTLVVAPIKAIVPTQTIPSSGTQEFFQYGPLPGGPITVLDANLDPIDLSGKNLKLVMTCNRDTAIAFKLVSGVGGQLTVGGTDNNQVTVDGDSTYTQTAGDFTWNLRDADTDFGYAWGTWRILPMANDVPA